MLPSRSIKSLYPLALAEGEGVGTAYEYYAKRLVLRRWLPRRPAGTLLVAGLPEKYGCSLDHLLLAEELGLEVVVMDERPEALAKAENALIDAQRLGQLTDVKPHFQLTADVATLPEAAGPFAWAICNEVLQRLPPAGRQQYVQRLTALAPLVSIFAPNGDNEAHVTHSGLKGIARPVLVGVSGRYAKGSVETGYCDMPPFPPGISRSAEQRQQAESGRIEAAAMFGLGLYARLERFLPAGYKRDHAHILYLMVSGVV